MKFDFHDFRQWHVSMSERYSKYVLAWHELYQFLVSKEKGTCKCLKRLQRTENKLFGEKVPGLTKALRNGDQVIIHLLFSQIVNKLSLLLLRKILPAIMEVYLVC